MPDLVDHGPTTVFGLARTQLEGLAGALHLDLGDRDGAGLVVDLFDELCAGTTGDPGVNRAPRWSGLSDDCTPVEFSVAFRPNGADLRVLVEAQADPPSPSAYWDAAGRLTSWLEGRIGASLDRFAAIEDLLAPADRPASGPPPFCVAMHAVEVRCDGPPRAKLYLNPAARGVDAAPEVLGRALDRLGLGSVWDALAPQLSGVPIELVALDLEDGPEARVKLYTRPRAGMEEVERIAGLATGSVRGAGTDLLRALSGGTTLRRPAFVVLQLLAGAPEPVRSVVDLPVPGHVISDAACVEAIGRLLETEGLDAVAYRRVAAAMASSGTEPDPGLLSYVSVQREQGRARITTYLNSRAFAPRFGWLAADPTTTWPRPV